MSEDPLDPVSNVKAIEFREFIDGENPFPLDKILREGVGDFLESDTDILDYEVVPVSYFGVKKGSKDILDLFYGSIKEHFSLEVPKNANVVLGYVEFEEEIPLIVSKVVSRSAYGIALIPK